MPTQTRNGTAQANVTVTGHAWTGPSINLPDFDWGLSEFNALTDYLADTVCAFTIPSGSTITRIDVTVFFGASDQIDMQCYLTLDGTTPTGTYLRFPADDVYAVHADKSVSFTDTRATDRTPAEINASTFGILLQSWDDSHSSFYGIFTGNRRITVYYTPGGGGGPQAQSALFNFLT